MHALVEYGVLRSRQRFGREHNNRQLTRVRILPEMPDDRKTVQAWHEEIEQHDIGLLLGETPY